MEHILDFIYEGEVSVDQIDLEPFLELANKLKIKGLTQSKADTTKQKRKRSLEDDAAFYDDLKSDSVTKVKDHHSKKSKSSAVAPLNLENEKDSPEMADSPPNQNARAERNSTAILQIPPEDGPAFGMHSFDEGMLIKDEDLEGNPDVNPLANVSLNPGLFSNLFFKNNTLKLLRFFQNCYHQKKLNSCTTI